MRVSVLAMEAWRKGRVAIGEWEKKQHGKAPTLPVDPGAVWVMAKSGNDYLRKALEYTYPAEDAGEIIQAILDEFGADSASASVGNPYVVAVGLI